MKRGIITAYSADMGAGVIHTEDQQRYVFTKVDWQEPMVAPESEMLVTFDTSGIMGIKVSPVKKD